MRLRTALLWAWFLGLTACFAAPFGVKVKGDMAQIEVSTLGEYPTSVRRIRLSEAESGSLVWELSSGPRVPQIWDFTLRAGLNPAQLPTVFRGREYHVVAPRGRSSFLLRRNVVYRLEMWGETSWWRTSREFSFGNP